jgi:hypothetical protein
MDLRGRDRMDKRELVIGEKGKRNEVTERDGMS